MKDEIDQAKPIDPSIYLKLILNSRPPLKQSTRQLAVRLTEPSYNAFSHMCEHAEIKKQDAIANMIDLTTQIRSNTLTLEKTHTLEAKDAEIEKLRTLLDQRDRQLEAKDANTPTIANNRAREDAVRLLQANTGIKAYMTSHEHDSCKALLDVLEQTAEQARTAYEQKYAKWIAAQQAKKAA